MQLGIMSVCGQQLCSVWFLHAHDNEECVNPSSRCCCCQHDGVLCVYMCAHECALVAAADGEMCPCVGTALLRRAQQAPPRPPSSKNVRTRTLASQPHPEMNLSFSHVAISSLSSLSPYGGFLVIIFLLFVYSPPPEINL